MFYDDCGRKFKNEDEIKAYAEKEFLEDEEIFVDYIANEFTVEELLKWILKNNKEKFIKDHQNTIKWGKVSYVRDFFITYDIEEM